MSKKALKVNFARNDVLYDCPVMENIKADVRELAGPKAKAAPMTDGQRQHLAEQIITGHLGQLDALKAKVITAVNGRHYTVDSMARWTKLSVAPTGDRPAQRAMDNQVCFMLSRDTLDRFDVNTPEELLGVLRKAAGQYLYRSPRVVSYEEATAPYQGALEILDDGDLNADQRAWLALAKSAYYPIWSKANPDDRGAARQLHVGQSQSSEAWTDGRTYVAISQEFLKELDWNAHGFTQIGALLVRMFCHEGDSTKGMPDQTYFEEVTRVMQEGLPQFVQSCIENSPRVLEVEGRRLTKKIADWQSEVQKAADSRAAFEAKRDEANKRDP